MTRVEYLKSMLPVLYPDFYTLYNADKSELVFWNLGQKLEADIKNNITGLSYASYLGLDKTQCEATQNHVHIFNQVDEDNRQNIIEVGTKIAKHLLDDLMSKIRNPFATALITAGSFSTF